jgi:hypothetical protein
MRFPARAWLAGNNRRGEKQGRKTMHRDLPGTSKPVMASVSEAIHAATKRKNGLLRRYRSSQRRRSKRSPDELRESGAADCSVPASRCAGYLPICPAG